MYKNTTDALQLLSLVPICTLQLRLHFASASGKCVASANFYSLT